MHLAIWSHRITGEKGNYLRLKSSGIGGLRNVWFSRDVWFLLQLVFRCSRCCVCEAFTLTNKHQLSEWAEVQASSVCWQRGARLHTKATVLSTAWLPRVSWRLTLLTECTKRMAHCAVFRLFTCCVYVLRSSTFSADLEKSDTSGNQTCQVPRFSVGRPSSYLSQLWQKYVHALCSRNIQASTLGGI